jgi:hypothetical protein
MNKFIFILGMMYSFHSLHAFIDTHYIKTYPDKFLIKPFLAHNAIAMQYNLPRNLPTEILKPNNTIDLGICLAYKWLGINYAYGIVNAHDKKKYGKSDFTDMKLSFYHRKHIIDAAVQNYKGFYLENASAILRNFDPTKPLPQRRDIEIWNIGANYLYVANGKKLSFKASYLQSERQKKSAGSLLLGAGFYYFNIGSDSSIIPKEYKKQDSLQKEEQFINGYFLIPSLRVGYAYNLILFKRVNILASALPSISLEQYNFNTESEKKILDYKMNLQLELRYAIQYSGDKFFCGFSGVTNAYSHKLRQSDFTFITTRLETYIGWRMEPFWKKKQKEEKKIY